MMNQLPQKKYTGIRLLAFWILSSLLPLSLSAQEEGRTCGEDVFELSPFTVTTSQDVGYLSTNSTSGTSLNTAIKDLPMSIQVINQDFITDIGASDLEEALSYAAGVFTTDNQASNPWGRRAVHQGGGSGDRSISSAGTGSRFANIVYIRGLATPYQNRMGFRYGGLVVTPNSDVALGGHAGFREYRAY
jgi:iron complex outermembrane receptor protein